MELGPKKLGEMINVVVALGGGFGPAPAFDMESAELICMISSRQQVHAWTRGYNGYRQKQSFLSGTLRSESIAIGDGDGNIGVQHGRAFSVFCHTHKL